MKCRIMRHFIWVFTVCQNRHLGGTSIYKDTVKSCATIQLYILYYACKFRNKILFDLYRECSGSVVECLTREREAAGSSLTGIYKDTVKSCATIQLYILYYACKFRNKILFDLYRECSGSVVECLTREREAAGSSLTGVTALLSLSKTHLS